MSAARGWMSRSPCAGWGCLPSGCPSWPGKNGRLLEEIIIAYGIQPDCIWVEGETRVSYVIAEASSPPSQPYPGRRAAFPPRACPGLARALRRPLKDARFAILAGSIPACPRPRIIRRADPPGAGSRRTGLDRQPRHVCPTTRYPVPRISSSRIGMNSTAPLAMKQRPGGVAGGSQAGAG